MPDTSERVTVRIPQDLLEQLKKVQVAEGHATISDTIREGLERYVELKMTPSNIKKIVVDLSRQDNHQLEELVHEGGSVSVDDAIRSAVREYVRMKLESLGHHPTTGTPPSRSAQEQAKGLVEEAGGSAPSS
jgi:Arc/MetJ-type ribon-helix-helix transcriptional regulator